jgi:hypothetical protein
MESHRLAIALFVPVLFACVVGGVACNFGLYYATPETESAFLKSYTPEHVIDRFREKESYSHTRNFGSGAGRIFVNHEAGFEFFVVLRRENWMPLMNALRDNALQQLTNNGAEVLSQSGTSQDGFRFDYKLNQSTGSLRILPVATSSRVQRNMPLPQGMEDVTVKIEQTERWFPKKIDTIRISSAHFDH